jgi:hypothetical protein
VPASQVYLFTYAVLASAGSWDAIDEDRKHDKYHCDSQQLSFPAQCYDIHFLRRQG